MKIFLQYFFKFSVPCYYAEMDQLLLGAGLELSGLMEILFAVLIGVITKTLYGLNGSVKELNMNIAIVVERTASHEKRLDKLEDKVDKS